MHLSVQEIKRKGVLERPVLSKVKHTLILLENINSLVFVQVFG